MNSDQLSYVTITGDREDPEFYGAVVARVHSHNSAQVGEEGRLGVHFLGNASVRIFGAGAALQHFGNNPQVRRLLGRAHTTQPATVPAGAPLVRVSRNNAADRDKPSYRARYLNYGRRSNELKASIREQAAGDAVVHLRSLGTQQSFGLRVKATPVPADAARVVRFNSYGFCLEGGIPVF